MRGLESTVKSGPESRILRIFVTPNPIVNYVLKQIVSSVILILSVLSCGTEHTTQTAVSTETKDSAFFISRNNKDTIYTGVPFKLEGFWKDTTIYRFRTNQIENSPYAVAESPKFNYVIDSATFEARPVYYDSMSVATPGKDTFELPERIPYMPLVVPLEASIPQQTSALRRKENARVDIQYLNSESGLPSSYINTILFSKSGIMWIGTPKGLCRFDGSFVTTYTSENGLPDDFISELFEDSKGNLWMGTQYGGAACYDGKNLTILNKENGLHANNISGIQEDSKGNIWFGIWGGGIARFDGKTVESIDRENGLLESRVQAIAVDKSDRVWIATNGKGIYYYDGKSIYNQDRASRLGEQYLTCLLVDSNERLWKGGWLSMAYLSNDDSLYHFNPNKDFPGLPTSEIFEDSQGNIWISSFATGVSRYDGKSFMTLVESAGLTSNKVNDIGEDPAGNIWFATDGGGLCRYNPNSFNYFDESAGLNSKMVNSIAELEDGRIAFATDEGMVFFNDTSFLRLYLEQSENHQGGRAYDICRTQDNDVWFSILNHAVFRISQDSIRFYGRWQGIHDHNVTAIAQRKNGEIWFGAWNVGLSRLNENGFCVFNAASGLHNFIITDLVVDQKDNLWIATDGEGITKYDGIFFTHYTENEGLASNHVNAFYEDSFGNIWVMGKKGINRIDSQGITDFAGKELLPDRDVVSMIQDSDGNYWIFTANGLLYLKLKAGAAPTSWNLANYDPKLFTQFDGLIGMDFIPRSVLVDSKDRIWFGTGKGLMMKNLSSFDVTPKVPQLNLETVKLNGHFINFNHLDDDHYDSLFADFDQICEGLKPPAQFENMPSALTLPPDVNHLTFMFSAQGWFSDKIKFSYLLDGVDEKWSQPSKDAWAEYRNLSHGDYIFKLKGIGESNVESPILEYAFTILPPWYHTWWARILFLLLLMLGVRLVVRVRTRQLKLKQVELEQKVQERTAELDVKNKALVSQNAIIEEQKAEAEKRKEEIEKQHTLLEETHKEIKDSINYAKRIQEAILPTNEIIDQWMPENFVFYRPKDVVAGDFYWIHKLSDGVLFSAADCTGHGVPGAMVSVVCYNALNRSVREFGQSSPEKILDKTREIVLETFQQNSAQVNDGMDAALIAIRQTSAGTILEFCGANNSAIIIRNQEIIELEGDKQPVGNYQDAKPFKLHRFALQKGDMLYLCTDGYADQFGGPKGKKLKSKVLKELLLSLSVQPLYQQKEKLVRFLEDWKGDLEQLDDISVFGFRI